MVKPEIVKLDTQYLIGMKIKTTLGSKNEAWFLWEDFFKRVPEIKNRIGKNFYSLHHYGNHMVNKTLTQNTTFIKYATVQVSPSDEIPKGMELLELKPQTYAVFKNIGYPRDLKYAYNRIYQVWLPETKHELSSGYHIEIMKPSYANHRNEKAEEVIYVPIHD